MVSWTRSYWLTPDRMIFPVITPDAWLELSAQCGLIQRNWQGVFQSKLSKCCTKPTSRSGGRLGGRSCRNRRPRLGSWPQQIRVAPAKIVSERALRPAMLWRKGGFGSDSAAGRRFVERLLTVAGSCRQPGRPLLGLLVAAVGAALQGTVRPSLLPVGEAD